MTDKKKQPGPKGFILVDLVDKGNIVEIPLTSNKAWLTLFYALPEELVSRAIAYLDFPRCPYEVLRTDKYDEFINDGFFWSLSGTAPHGRCGNTSRCRTRKRAAIAKFREQI